MPTVMDEKVPSALTLASFTSSSIAMRFIFSRTSSP